MRQSHLFGCLKKSWKSLLGLALAAHVSPLHPGTVSVNAATTYQTIDGFGAATVWNGISTQAAPVLWTDQSSNLISNTTAFTNGYLGLSIVRTRIDPGEESSGTNIWNSELNQIVLARKTNAHVSIFATPWTPPTADKENGAIDGSGNNNNFNGLPTTNDGATGQASADSDFAAYLVKYLQYGDSYLTSNGATGVINAISCQNEPDYNPGSYESAIWTGPQFDTFVGSYLGPAMQSAGLLSDTKIILTESFHDNLALAANTMDDATAAAYVGIIGGHLYGATVPPPTLASANWSHYSNQRYWETEICDESSATETMAIGIEEVTWLYNCIVNSGMNAYNHWWINTSGTTGKDIYATDTNQPTFTGCSLGNFSKFIRPGFIRVGATQYPEGGSSPSNASVWCSAYVSPTASRVVIVAINSSTSTSYTETFNLSGLGNVTQVAPWITDSANLLVQQSLVSLSGGTSFSYTLPAQSVVTFVGDCGNPPTATPTFTASPSPSHSPTATVTPTAVPTRDACQSVIAVSCGSTAPTTSSHLGLTFQADQQYTPGSAPGASGSYGYVSWAAGTALTTTNTITGSDATDATLYNNERYGATLGYAFSVPNGQAYVTFYWAEVYATQTGQRVFSVAINGSTVESALDLYATTGGENITFQTVFPVTVTNGVISIVETESANNALLQGISVQYGTPCTATPTISRTGTVTKSPTLSSTATPSPTPTNTPLATKTATPSSTPTLIPNSPSTTGTESFTAPVTAEASATPSLIPTATYSPSATATVSGTVSSDETSEATPPTTATPTSSASALSTATPTSSALALSTATPTSSASALSTAIPTSTASALATATPTSTASALSSATPTSHASALATATPTSTASATPSPTAVNESKPTIAALGVSSNSDGVDVLTILGSNYYEGAKVDVYNTATNVTTTVLAVSVFGSTTITANINALFLDAPVYVTVLDPNGSVSNSKGYSNAKTSPVAGGPVIIDHGPFPNPNPTAILVDLGVAVDSVEIRIYAENLVYVATVDSPGSLPAGWQQVPLRSTLTGAANGLYFYKVIAHVNGAMVNAAKTGKLFLNH